MDDNSLDSATIKLWTERAHQSLVNNDAFEKIKVFNFGLFSILKFF